MTTKQIKEPANLLTVIGVFSPFIIIAVGWAISINVRIKALELDVDNIKQKGSKMESTLDDINRNLASIAISINTLTVKLEENEKTNNRKLENHGIRY